MSLRGEMTTRSGNVRFGATGPRRLPAPRLPKPGGSKVSTRPINVESLTGDGSGPSMTPEVGKPRSGLGPQSRAAMRKSSGLSASAAREEEFSEAEASIVGLLKDQEPVEDAEDAPESVLVEQKQDAAKDMAVVYQQVEKPRLVVEAPSLPSEKTRFVETPLPGIADEVESYPCKFCPERVFLTSFGLERHTKMAHPERLNEILVDISHIQEEWKLREKEREKQRERLALAKIRQEALAAAAAREAFQGMASSGSTEDEELMAMEVAPRGLVAPSTKFRKTRSLGLDDLGTAGRAGSSRSSQFESCRICGLLINSEHPTAMENHMRAHRKNDELRAHLLSTYGPEFVARVTCHECQLVFTDERKLISHAEAMHVRRRKYVCKWCGHVCLTMTDLNNHKSEVHGMPVSRNRDPEARKNRQMASMAKGRGLQRPLGAQSGGTRRSTGASSEAVRGGGPRVLTSVEELPCRTTCDFCGLVMVKPSLLIRHMMRVHNRTNFTATVETKGMPSFKITVEKGKLSWSCCAESYTDRSAFVHHRRSNHTPKLSQNPRMYFDSESAAGQQVTAVGEDGQQYVLLLVQDDGAADAKTPTTPAAAAAAPDADQQICLTPDQLQQLGISAEEAENLVFLVDDGSGNLSTPDGQPVVLDQNQLQGGQVLVMEEGGATDAPDSKAQGIVVTGHPPTTSSINYQQFLNTDSN